MGKESEQAEKLFFAEVEAQTAKYEVSWGAEGEALKHLCHDLVVVVVELGFDWAGREEQRPFARLGKEEEPQIWGFALRPLEFSADAVEVVGQG